MEVIKRGENTKRVFGLSSELGHKLQDPDKYFKIPAADHLDGLTEDLPYFLVDDEIFPQKTWLMCPYPGRELPDEEKSVYNYRLSRARRTIENAFGILAARW